MAEMPTSVPEITTVIEPLLTPRLGTSPSPSAGGDRTSMILSAFLGLFAGRRGASMIVRENVALQLEDWREDWGYTLPVVVFDTMWNIAFVVVSIVMLIWTALEKPNVPLRVWICGYSLQCAVHVVLVWKEYKRRNRRVTIAESLASSGSSGHFEDAGDDDTTIGISTVIRPSRRWEKLNRMISYIWWVIGFFLIFFAYEVLLHVAPRLFWLTLAFLAVDGIFAAIGLLFSCLVGLAVCFCFPCIIALLYFTRRQEGASASDISVLPKYKFEMSNDQEQPDGRTCRMVPMKTNGPDFSVERFLLSQDADCCICLCHYEEGAKLHLLPCNHHFHAGCILKWLMVKATCPLCNCIINLIEQV